jgi:hypothetical protein
MPTTARSIRRTAGLDDTKPYPNRAKRVYRGAAFLCTRITFISPTIANRVAK